ncbi:MAG TPA: DUF2520 domain-containing protein [Roseiflexaceae bacterium]|nr:DUF2520 domain-containing protein [Roseiflexaceae bacterium]HMP38914.1 DUF2520 domain-containing protein [Roseiflexaceae bacterium]
MGAADTSFDPQVSRIGLIGAGRAGSALAIALAHAGLPPIAIASRDPDHAATLAQQVGAMALSQAEVATRTDVVFITTSDRAIGIVCAHIAAEVGWRSGQAVVHCSGIGGRELLAAAAAQGAHTGVLHPLQTLPGATGADRLAGSFFGVEADEPLNHVLRQIVQRLGGQPFDLSGIDRAAYHAAAALTANYSIALYAIAVELLQRIGIDHATSAAGLLALLRGAVANLEHGDAATILTGPVARGDEATIAAHLAALEHTAPEWRMLYGQLAAATLPLALAQGLPPDAAMRIRRLIDGDAHTT